MADDKRYKFSWMDLVKIFLVFMGIADAFSFLPDSLDIFDKVFTSAILFYFWIKLRPMKFLFGYPLKSLNYFIIGSFYILVINTFIPFVPALLPYGNLLSIISIITGSILLILISVFITMRVKFGGSSFIKRLFEIFDGKKRYWKRFNQGKYPVKKFFIVLIVLFGMSQYLFGLVNQWLIVSLDKSLIIVALLFAVKDLESSKIKALRTAGSFDDNMLKTVTGLFTRPKKIHLGLGFLLIFHYLSDLGAFFITYIFNTAKDPYYFSLLGDKFLETGQVISQHHQTLIQLISNEASTLAQPNLWMTYILSAAGMILLLLLPIIVCFFLAYKVNLKKLVERKGFVIALIGAFITIFTFILYPWVQQKAIRQPNILGVDFITNKISTSAFISMDYIILIFGVFLILGLFLFNSKIARLGATSIFMVSLMFLGIYIWNFFLSSTNFYLNSDYGGMIFFIGNNNYIVVLTLTILYLLDVFFYIGSFLLFAYHSLKYFIEYILKDLLNNKFIVGLSFFVIIATMMLLLMINKNNFNSIIQILFAFIVVCLIFSYAFYKVLLGKKEFRDDFILAIIFVVFSYLGMGIVTYYLEVSQGFPETWLNLITPIIMTGISILLIRFFKLKTLWKEIKLTPAVLAGGIGILSGGIFYLLNEPIVNVISNHALELIIFTFFIALSEEFLFRHVIYRIAQKSFSERTAQVIQALTFSLLHFLILKAIIAHYAGSIWMMPLYFIGVFMFGLVLGRFVAPKKVTGRKPNIWYAIICHWMTNMVLYGLILSLA